MTDRSTSRPKSERFEWLEIPPGKKYKRSIRPKTDINTESKRCPRCGWLDLAAVQQCFRCGYDYEADAAHLDFFKAENIRLPDTRVKINLNFKKLLSKKSFDKYEDYRLRLASEDHQLVSGFDRLISLDSLNIIHYDYQIATALEALKRMRGQVLLADEVGLGKTIEAAIIMKELIERNLVKTVLVLVPASLVGQWQDELLVKFGEHFTIPKTREDWEADRIVVSLDLAKKKEQRKYFANKTFDLLIVDEAHRLKHRGTMSFKFVNQIRKKYVLLLTATPLHNDLTELYSLITILKPGLLGTIRSFKKKFVLKDDPRIPMNEHQLREILAEVMIRNRRDKTGVKLPRRRAAVYHLDLSEEEKELYELVSEYIREEFQKETDFKHHHLSLGILQRELCSSHVAVRETLMKFLKRSYPQKTKNRLTHFIELCDGIGTNRKTTAVLEILDQFPGKTIVFVEFLKTMHFLKAKLEATGYTVELFHGGLSGTQERRKALERFKNEKDILISTQSGGEGLNLQFCSQLINFDLPWNPMRVEQRIGRIHRLGQQHEVMVFNLSVNETIESRILDLLSYKIRMFELVIGELDLILGDLDPSKSFEQLIYEIFKTSKSDKDLDSGFEKLGETLEKLRDRFDHLKDNEAILSDITDL